jgi:hypothetical protein
MKSVVRATVVAIFVAVPIVSFAQSGQPATRADVRAEFVQLQKAGYKANDTQNYPANMQRAEEIVAQQNNGTTAYGSGENGASQSGK